MAIKKVAALGAGTMGGQVGFWHAIQGYDVTLYDVSEEALVKCKLQHQRYADELRTENFPFIDEEIDAGLARLTYTTDLAVAVIDADLVSESVPEILEVKQKVYEDLDRLCPEHTILTTNTSTMLPSDLAKFIRRPERFLALHYANPIWTAPIAEVMGHSGTDKDVINEVLEYAKASNLTPIKIDKEQPGYIINSLLVPWLVSGLSLVANGICSYKDVDRTWMICSHMGMGPCGVADVVGFEVARNISRLLQAAEPTNPQHALNIEYLEENFINKGHTGVLSGKGFYSYPNPEYQNSEFLRS